MAQNPMLRAMVEPWLKTPGQGVLLTPGSPEPDVKMSSRMLRAMVKPGRKNRGKAFSYHPVRLNIYASEAPKTYQKWLPN